MRALALVAVALVGLLATNVASHILVMTYTSSACTGSFTITETYQLGTCIQSTASSGLRYTATCNSSWAIVRTWLNPTCSGGSINGASEARLNVCTQLSSGSQMVTCSPTTTSAPSTTASGAGGSGGLAATGDGSGFASTTSAGIAVGGSAFVAAAGIGIWFWMQQRYGAAAAAQQQQQPQQPVAHRAGQSMQRYA
jgi:hypothetical protein